MAKITLKGNAVNTSGSLPKIGTTAADFHLVGTDLSTKTRASFGGKTLILNIFPSVDTGTCAASVRNFNKTAANLENTLVLCISRDLPFAQKRFCGAEGIDKVVTLTDFRNEGFAKNYGVELIDGGFKGLCARAIVVFDKQGKVKYTELVPQIGQEPNYEAALKAI